MEIVSKYIQNLKMAVIASPRQNFNTFSPTQMETLEAINQTLQTTYKNAQISRSISRLQEKLDSFDSETTYNDIHNDLTEKYNLAKEHYKNIEELRNSRKLKSNDDSKKLLASKLDEVVTTLVKDFSKFREEKYMLLDEIFLIKTNSNIKYDLEDLSERVEAAIRRPEIIYSDEYDKMFRIHVILDEEEQRLKKLID